MKAKKTDLLLLIVVTLSIAAALAYAVFTKEIPFIDDILTTKEAAKPQHASPPGAARPMTSIKTLDAVIKNAEDRIDPAAIREADLAAVREKAALLKAKEKEVQYEVPLTDVAPPPPAVAVTAAEHPYERLQKMGLEAPPQYQVKQIPPQSGMDESKPPRWNETIAAPKPPTEAPNPFEPPPIAVNPERVPADPQ